MGQIHELAIWGQAAPALHMIRISKNYQVESQMFGGLPADTCLYCIYLANGGLEHKYACSLNYPTLGLWDKYGALQLVAHEFSLVDVKQIRPKALEVFDYQENYTPSLWFSEGTTSYYDNSLAGWNL